MHSIKYVDPGQLDSSLACTNQMVICEEKGGKRTPIPKGICSALVLSCYEFFSEIVGVRPPEWKDIKTGNVVAESPKKGKNHFTYLDKIID